MTLDEYQQQFIAALGQGEVPSNIVQAERFSIYQNNMRVGLKQYLADVFPVCKKLVGEAFFNGLCHAFIQCNLPDNGNIHHYGGTFSTFIRQFSPAQSLEYLPDVAALEWAHQQSHYADEPANLQVAQLMQQGEDALMNHAIRLKPSVHLLQSNYPIAQIWAQSQDDYSGEFNVNLDSGGCQLLIFRAQWQVQIWQLNAAAWQLMQHAQQFSTLGEIIAHTVAEHDAQLVQSFLADAFAQQLFCSLANATPNPMGESQ